MTGVTQPPSTGPVMTDPAFSRSPMSTAAFAGTEARSFRDKIGDIEVVALSDGGVPVPRPPGTPGSSEMILRPLACLLVRLPGEPGLVLIDAGFGPVAKRAGLPLPTAGRLVASLSAAGVALEDIGTVLISHIHPDHVDGLYDDDGVPIYPKATYRVGAEELAFWSQADLDLSWSPSPAPFKAEMLATAKRLVGFAGSTLETFHAGEPAMPGIETVLLPGHTPGQVGFIMSSGGKHLLYTADALTTPEMSIATPDRQNPIDLDPELGVRTRKTLLDKLCQPGWHSFSPHFPWPNLGSVEKLGDHYRWNSVG